mmetsp:Transcript_36338/g.112436  ORF Transcript_36338/g.112436 Transcript_36338/m.112436 type:complete len:122 (+) Transcript_36338:187-552(+)
MSADDVAKAFIPHYYNLFDTNRAGLVSLFRNESTLTFEGDGPKTGPAAIMEKFNALPPVQHQPQTIETQPSTTPNAILVFCTGQILIEAGKPLKYSEVFQLVASAPGQYYLHNVIFRFNYA